MRKGNSSIIRRGAAAAAALALVLSAAAAFVRAQTPAGTTISNRARLVYTEPDGERVETFTNVVTVQVAVVNGVSVTPKETAPSGSVESAERVTAAFSVCNTGNSTLPYQIGSAGVTAPAQVEGVFLDADSSGSVTQPDVPVVFDVTKTPRLAPGTCTPVLVVYSVNGAAPLSEIVTTLQAHSPADDDDPARQPVKDTGTIRRTVKKGPTLRDPDDPTLPPRKTVNDVEQVTAGRGQAVEFRIAFRNDGESHALNVRVDDAIPPGLTFVPGSLRLEAAGAATPLTGERDADAGEVTGQALQVRVPSVAPGELVAVTFGARVGALPGGTVLVNRAFVTADNAERAQTRDVRVIVAPQGVVFDGVAGQTSPVAGASVRVLTDARLVAGLPEGGFVPNDRNANPFVTAADGAYCFRLAPQSQASTYYLVVEAAQYRPRLIALTVTPQPDQLFGLTIRALDGQALAVAGGFTLTKDAVSIDSLGALAANVPVFPEPSLSVSKTVDRATAQIGDVISYRVEVKNTSRVEARDVEVRDTLPQGFYYAPGTALVSVGGAPPANVEPVTSGDTIIFRFASVPAGGTLVLTYRVRIGVNARVGEQTNVVVAVTDGGATPPARAPVLVRGGLFATTQFLTGRVFVDANGNGKFDDGDAPVAGARLFTSTGRAVITDPAGNYNLPLLPDGQLVIQLDPSSVPYGLAPRDRRRLEGSGWSRLVTTPLQGGAMLNALFALAPVADTPTARAAEAPNVVSGGHGREGAGAVVVAAPAPPKVTAPAVAASTSPPVPEEAAAQPRKKRVGFFKRLLGPLFGRPAGESGEASRRDKKDDSHAKNNPRRPTARPHTPLVIYSASGDVVYQEPPPSDAQAQPVAPKSAPGATPQVPRAGADVRTPGRPAPDARAAAPRAGVGDLRPAVTTPGLPAATYAADKATAATSPPPPTLIASLAPPPAVAAPPTATAPNANLGLERVEPGAVALDLESNLVLLGPALDVPVRFPAGWASRLFVNGVPVDANRVGKQVVDHATQTQQDTYVGVALLPGPNTLRAVAVSPDGRESTPREVVVYGRGPATRLVVAPASADASAGRRGSTDVVVSALDAWDHPAQDGDLVLSTTLGELQPTPAASARADRPATEERAPELSQKALLRLSRGAARARIVAPDEPGTARLLAETGKVQGGAEIVFRAEGESPRMLVGYANLTLGRAAPLMQLRGVDEAVRGSLQFFYRGHVFGDSVLTLAYDSQTPLQRLDARDHLFQLDPLEHTYQTFGDTSARYDAAPSNSKAYARLDFGRRLGRSYALFGDFTPDSRGTEFNAYNRKLTGAQLHFENSKGSYVSFGAARPSTVFGRDVFAGGLFGIARLSASRVLPGSETVVVEVRDRRNPDLVVRREQLVRGADYNLDADTGQLFLLRQVPTFDPALNLEQIVVTYEYEAAGARSNVYTLRAVEHFGEGGSFGVSLNYQGQGSLGAYTNFGVDLAQETARGGLLRMEYGVTMGNLVGSGTYFSGGPRDRHDGGAVLASLDQPLRWRGARLQLSYRFASSGFFNPYGATIVGGTTRAGASLDLQATPTARLRLGFTRESTDTDAVKNSRETAGVTWTQRLGEHFTGSLAYDFRSLHDESGGKSRTTDSNMVTAGLDWTPNDRLTLSARREQNLTASDPTYPNQTVLSGSYKLNDVSRLFFTQRLSSAPITPISDLTGAGFASTESRNEFTAGVETKLLRDTSLMGGYRMEHGQNGVDGFAVAGITQSWKLDKTLALDAGYERAFHMTGKDYKGGYDSLTAGLTWNPRDSFVANTRYEWRDRDGSAHLLSAGFAGKPTDDVTAIGRFQWASGSQEGQSRRGAYGSFGVALRPAHSERAGAFVNYQYRALDESSAGALTLDKSHTLSADAFLRATPRLTFFAKAAASAQKTATATLSPASNFTYLLQGRFEYLLSRRFDAALEARWLAQPSTRTARLGYAPEIGFWATPDVRLAVGYNYFRAVEQPGRSVLDGGRRGFYFSVSTKLERLFDFVGAQKKAAGEKH